MPSRSRSRRLAFTAGGGVDVLTPARGPPVDRVDAAYLATVESRDLETAVWHMTDTQTPRMPHMGATLDENEVRAIVEWLKREDRLAR